jgi:hypothetical protein
MGRFFKPEKYRANSFGSTKFLEQLVGDISR